MAGSRVAANVGEPGSCYVWRWAQTWNTQICKGTFTENENLIVVFRQRPSKSEIVFDKVEVSLKLKILIKVKVVVVYSTYSNKPLLDLLRSKSS